jgi:hypothetical protein
MTSSSPWHSAWDWVGYQLKDPAGEKIGEVLEVYVDTATGEPAWLAISTGWFGTRVSLVPVAHTSPQGDHELVTKWSKEQVRQAPHVPADGELTDAEERALFAYYGVDYDEYTPSSPEGVGQQAWTARLRRHPNEAGARSPAATDAGDVIGDLLRPHPAATDHDLDEHRVLNFPPGGEPKPR